MIGSLSWLQCLTIERTFRTLETPFVCTWNVLDHKLYFEIYSFYRGVFRAQSNILNGCFLKIVKRFHLLFIFTKSSMLDIWLDSEHASSSLPYVCVLYCTVAWCNIYKYFTRLSHLNVISLAWKVIKPFVSNAPFLYPWKHQGFLMFSEGREKVHWEQMG